MNLQNILIRHQKQVTDLQHIITHHPFPLSLISHKNFSNSLRNKNLNKYFKPINLSLLNNILNLDPKSQIAIVEPKVTFSTLVQQTLKFGLIPKVVPEFKNITLGGAIAGASLESSSFKFGQFSDTCQELEVILGNGSLIRASSKENSDLFYALFGSYGTLGIITEITLELMAAPSFVELSLKNLPSLDSFGCRIQENVDFLEAIALSPKKRVAIEGRLTAVRGDLPLYRTQRPWNLWYYQLIDKLSRQKEPRALLPLYDYLFRYDRGAFWMGRFFSLTSHPTFIFRALFGWALSSKSLYKMLHRLSKKQAQKLFFIHDFYVPSERAESCYRVMTQQLPFFPVWFCPVKGTEQPQLFAPHYGAKHFVNIGFYGRNREKDLTRAFEKKVYEHGGRKMLYSPCGYSKELFAKIYDLNTYEFLRKKYFAESAFVSIYEKIADLL